MSADAQRAAYLAAAHRALAQFPVQVSSLELVAVSENVTFRAATADGSGDLVLRLHRPGYNSLAELESERQWTAALAAAGVVVQAGLQTRSGGHFCSVSIPPGAERRYVGMTRWMPGRPLAEALAHGDDCASPEWAFRQIGRLAATLHQQARVWQAPPGFLRPRLDTSGLLGDAPRWGRFWEHGALTPVEQRLLLDARRQLAERLQDYGASAANFGLIHADLHAENVIVHGDQLGVIDFDDTAYGWYVYDLVTALVEHWGSRAFPSLRDALLSGYAEKHRLSEGDVAMLETFLLLRGMAIIGWFAGRPEHADSEFFAQIRERVMAACGTLIATRAPARRHR